MKQWGKPCFLSLYINNYISVLFGVQDGIMYKMYSKEYGFIVHILGGIKHDNLRETIRFIKRKRTQQKLATK